jgi:hypothetical protein
VSDVDLMQASNKASLLGLDKMGIEFDEMASIAVKLGKAMGSDAAKSVDDLTTALSRQSPMILDNLGLSVKLEDAYQKYADKIGVAASALDDEQKKLAFGEAAMSAAAEKAATLGEANLTLGEQISRLGNVLTNTRAELGAAANESSLAADALGGYTDVVSETIDNLSEAWDHFTNINEVMSEQIGLSVDLGNKYKDDLTDGLMLFLVPALGAANIAGKALNATLEYMDALTQRNAGKLDVANLPAVNEGPAISFSRKPGDIGLSPEADRAAHAIAQKELDAYVKERRAKYQKEQEDRLRALENGGEKAAKAVAKQHKEREKLEKDHQDRLAKLSGGDQVAKAIQASLDIKELKGKLGDDAAAKIFGELLDAKDIAKAIKPEAVAGIEEALRTLSTNPGVVRAAREQGAKVIQQFQIGMAGAKASDIRGIGGAIAINSYQVAGITGVLGQTTQGIEQLSSKFNDIGIPMSVVNDRFNTFIESTGKWNAQLDSAVEAFSQLAQITQGMGTGLDKISGGVGAVFGSAKAGQQFATSLGGLFGSANFAKTKTGAAAGGAMAGFSGGASLAALTGTTSAGKGALAGAAGGAASGAMAGAVAGPMGMAIGAGVGAIAGAIGGYFTAKKAAKEAKALMVENRKELLAFYGDRENLIAQAKRLGISEAEVNKNILNNEKDTKAYAKTVTKLSEASEKESKAAKKLAEGLNDVARVRGVVSKQQMKDVRAGLAAGEGAPQLQVAREFMALQADQLLGGLQGLASGPMTAGLVQAVGNALPAAFAELKRSGMSTVDALRAMAPTLQAFQANAVAAGLGSTEGFDTLNASLSVLTDEKLGPFVQRADLASQSLAALANLGYVNQQSFSGFAGSITESFNALKEGAGADQALMTLQGPLQNVWQLAKDFGYATDEATAALLEQAEAAGLVGDKFRPAGERMAEALDTVVERLDELIGVFTGELVTESSAGAQQAGAAILDQFAKVQPVVKVRYEYEMPDAPSVPTGNGGGTNAARTATQDAAGGDIYMDGERVGFIVGRHLGKVSDYAGA